MLSLKVRHGARVVSVWVAISVRSMSVGVARASELETRGHSAYGTDDAGPIDALPTEISHLKLLGTRHLSRSMHFVFPARQCAEVPLTPIIPSAYSTDDISYLTPSRPAYLKELLLSTLSRPRNCSSWDATA